MIKKEVIPALHQTGKSKIRLHLNNDYTFYGEPYTSQQGYDLISQVNDCEYSEQHIFVNTMYRSVSIMRRNGLSLSIPYVSSIGRECFIIRKIIKLRSSALKSTLLSLRSQGNIDDSELLEMKKIISNASMNSAIPLCIMVDYEITLQDLKVNNNTIYHYQSDTVVSLDDCIDISAHPYSSKFDNIGDFGCTYEYGEQPDLNLKFRYINHTALAQPLYINIANTVYVLKPSRSSPVKAITYIDKTGKSIHKLLEDYIEVYSSASSHVNTKVTAGVCIARYNIESARNELGVYNTYEEAFNCGDIDASRKEKILSMSHQIELLKQSSTISKFDLDKKELEYKKELLDKDHALESLKRQAAKEKQDHETLVLNIKMQQTLADEKIAKLEFDRKKQELKLKEQDLIIQRENTQFNDTIKKIRDENEYRIKKELMDAKDRYEANAFIRKENMDIIKMIPALIISFGAIYLAYDKLKNNQT